MRAQRAAGSIVGEFYEAGVVDVYEGVIVR